MQPEVNHKVPVGLFLQKQRIASGLKQREVAAELGWSTAQFLSNIERGVAFPPDEAIPLLSKLYKVAISKIIDAIVKAKEAEIAAWKKSVMQQEKRP